ncbi:MAG: 4-alpha-glucanotransferase [Merdibacter sp.]
MERCAGVLAAVSSLPGNQESAISTEDENVHRHDRQSGIHDLAAAADAGAGLWKFPYQPFSSFAGDPLFINIDRLSEIGLLKQSSIRNLNKFKESVSYDEVRAFKETYFRKAFYEFKRTSLHSSRSMTASAGM